MQTTNITEEDYVSKIVIEVNKVLEYKSVIEQIIGPFNIKGMGSIEKIAAYALGRLGIGPSPTPVADMAAYIVQMMAEQNIDEYIAMRNYEKFGQRTLPDTLEIFFDEKLKKRVEDYEAKHPKEMDSLYEDERGYYIKEYINSLYIEDGIPFDPRLHPRDPENGRFVRTYSEKQNEISVKKTAVAQINGLSKNIGNKAAKGKGNIEKKSYSIIPTPEMPLAEYGISGLTKKEAEQLPNFYPDNIAGVKRGNPMTFEEADSGNVNPFYKTRQEAFVSNCQSCILAFIARLRGYDVKAKPYAGDDKPIVMLAKDIRRGFIIDEQGTHPDFVKRKRIKGAVGTMFFLEKNIRNNEIYCLFVDDPLCQDAHVIITGRQGEELYLYDPQKNRIFFKEKIQNYFYGKSCNKTQMFRIDNAAFNPYFIDMTMEAK